jgi:glutathione S-transferase
VIKLYDFELSGNCYKVRLLAGMLGASLDRIPLDFYPGRDHKSPWFLKINPLGQLPVIDDEGFVLRDSGAILVYLARKYDPTGRWYPLGDAAMLGTVAMWLGFADSLSATAGAARLYDAFFYDHDIDACRAGAHALFRVLDEHLWFAEQEGQDFLCAGHPTIADIACFPYVMLSEEGGISRLPYPAIRRWTDRVKRIPGFSLMPGIFGTAPAAD